MSEVAELATRFKLSDPKPARCAACFASADPELRFVDFDCMIDRGTFTDPGGANAVLDSIDELHLCEPCVRAAAEIIGYKPELHRKQLREIRALDAEAKRWREYAEKLERTLERRPAPRQAPIR